MLNTDNTGGGDIMGYVIDDDFGGEVVRHIDYFSNYLLDFDFLYLLDLELDEGRADGGSDFWAFRVR